MAEPAGDRPEDPPATAAACPLFCARNAAAECTRPDVDDVSDASCGLIDRLRPRHGQSAPPGITEEPCPDHCCRPTGGEGPDTDADGLVDAHDRCPNEPEDAEGFEDQDGCPDADNDGDGVSDPNDLCCFAPEDADGVEDEDGCPDA